DGKPSSLFAIPGLNNYWGKDIFATEALTIEAKKALEHAKKLEQPFFLYMSHYAIHVPIDKDMRFYDKYRKQKGMTENEAAYAALIEGMDKSLGDLMDWLKENGEDKNTIIIFMSDNGGLASASSCRDGRLHCQNAPLSSGKGSAREGGIREPMIVSWPGIVKPDTRCNSYMIIEDFYPTILEMAGINDYKTVQTVDGKSIIPMLTGKGDTSKGRKLYWNCPNLWGNTGPGIGTTCTIRDGDWKLIYYYDNGYKELFNIKNDIGEINNLADDNPKILRRLSKELADYLRKTDAQRPSQKSTGKEFPWPDETK
ncbi:MAG: sulfatase-like hydrolase/transferase, partial [Bacteroidales bacterium]